jgi:hypothetical protein
MDGADLVAALRRHIKERRAELLENLLTTKQVRLVRGRVIELDEISKKLTELSKRGATNDDDEAD